MVLTRMSTGVAWLLLIILLSLSCVIGSASSVLALVLALGLAPFALRDGNWRKIAHEPAMLAFLATFLALLIVFAVRARGPADPAFALNFLALLLAPVIYLAAAAWPGRRLIFTVAGLSLIGTALAVVMTFVSLHLLHWERASSFGGGANLMPRVALALGFIAVAGVFVTGSRWRHLFYFGPVLAIIATYYSQSRGAALAIPPLLLIAAVFLAFNRRTRREIWEPIALVVLVGGLIALVPAGHLERFADTAGTVVSTVTSAKAPATADAAVGLRLDMYRTGLEAFRQAPILGNGWANLGNEAARINPEVFAAEAGTTFMYHNDAINFAVAAGLVGLIGLVALLAAPTLSVLGARRDALFSLRLYCCLQLAVAYAVFGLTDSTLGFDLPTTLYAFLVAIVLGVAPTDADPLAALAGEADGSTNQAGQPA